MYEFVQQYVPLLDCSITHICMVTHYSKSMDQPGEVANPARGQLSREMNIFLSAFAPDDLVSRDGLGSPVLRQPAYLHTRAELCALFVRYTYWFFVFIYFSYKHCCTCKLFGGSVVQTVP